MTHTKEPWINTGLKLDSEIPADVNTDDGMRFDNPYLYQPPKPAQQGHWTSNGFAGGVPIMTDEELKEGRKR
jgi:hypothetical protein